MSELLRSAHKKRLNVGGHRKNIPIPAQYAGWQHDLLDIDPDCKPDVLCDAREMHKLELGYYDAIYCSHNLEHYYLHDALQVLSGFIHVLKPNGFAHIRVPDIGQLMKTVVDNQLDVFDVLYQSPMGPIRVCDVLYGHQVQIEKSGMEYFAHKMGFTPASLKQLLLEAGFKVVALAQGEREVTALGFIEKPAESILREFDIKVET